MTGAAGSSQRKRSAVFPTVPFAILLLGVGCSSTPLERNDPFRTGEGRMVGIVLDPSGERLGVAVALHVGYGEAVFLSRPSTQRGEKAQALLIGEERLPVQVTSAGPFALLESPRRDLDIRPLVPASLPAEGDEIYLVSAGRGTQVDLWRSEVLAPSAGEGELLLGVARSWGDWRSPDSGELLGAAAFTEDAAFLGFVVVDRSEVGLRLSLLDSFLPRLLDWEEEKGRERAVLLPEDSLLYFTLRVDSVENLPAVSDDWGKPDFHLALEVAGRRLPPVPLLEGGAAKSQTLEVPAWGPVVASVVERDLSLADGEVVQHLTRSLEEPVLRQRMRWEFEMIPSLLEGPGAVPASRPGLELVIDPLQVDRSSGPDALPLGGTPLALGRVGSGSVSLVKGDASDFWLLEVEEPGEAWLVFFRQREEAVLQAEAFPPVFRSRLLAVLSSDEGPRLTVRRSAFPRGRVALRVRELVGGTTPGSSYSVLAVPADDPGRLVRVLFRLISREAQRGDAYISSSQFARDLAQELTAQLDPLEATGALLSQLGHRTAAVRQLALRLLEVHYRPSAGELERIQASGRGRRALDAGLLLALRRPGDARYLEVLRRAASDPDPLIRLRALVVASRFQDEGVRSNLLELFRADPSPRIQRVLQRGKEQG